MDEPIAPAEQVLYSGTVSHWHYAGRWFFILLLLGGLVATFFLPHDPAQENTYWIIRAVLGALAVILFLWMYIDRSRRKYLVTDHRVSVEFGILSKNSKEMRLEDIRSINLTTTGLSGLIGIGRVEFSSSSMDEDDVVFWNTPGAARIRDLVRAQQAKS